MGFVGFCVLLLQKYFGFLSGLLGCFWGAWKEGLEGRAGEVGGAGGLEGLEGLEGLAGLEGLEGLERRRTGGAGEACWLAGGLGRDWQPAFFGICWTFLLIS